MRTANPKLAPTTGHALPQYDEDAIKRAAAAEKARKTVHVDYGPQQAIAARMEVLRISSLGGRGQPFDGLGCSQVHQAGKSFMAERYRERVLQRTALTTGKVNAHQVLIIGLEIRVTLKMMCVMILRMLGDPHADEGNTDDVKLRVKEFMEERDVELLIIDEVQHLARDSQDRIDVTDEIKRFLDLGVVPVVMIGNEEAARFFKRNGQLGSRIGAPLVLQPVDPDETAHQVRFKKFCANLDEGLAMAGATRAVSDLTGPDQLDALLIASGGHIGRVCRIVQAALEHASLRDADFIELYDISHAIDMFAIERGYVSHNPLKGAFR